MRKDIFIVGAKLLGVMQLISAVYSLATIVAVHTGLIRPQGATAEYSSVRFVAEVAVGLFLVFRTEALFNLLNRVQERVRESGPPHDRVTASTTDLDG
jgi:hypothetical protein